MLNEKMNKNFFRSSVFLLFGFFLIILTSFVSSQTCYVDTAANCNSNGHHEVMGLSSSSNAHGELAAQSNYNTVLCCDFGSGSVSCLGNNKIVGLSSSTNAHAERPESNVYGTTSNVCYDSLIDCFDGTGTNPSVGEIEVISLSGTTNAHLGSVDSYNTNVICSISAVEEGECDLTNAYWNPNGEIANGTSVNMVIEGANCQGETISLEVYRSGFACSTISGCTSPSNVVFGAGGSVTGTWEANPPHVTNYSFVATVVGTSETEESPADLSVVEVPVMCEEEDITVCKDYDNEEDCNNNICSINLQDSVPENVDCSDPDKDCSCEWDDEEGICEPGWDGDDPEEEKLGRCVYTQESNDNCDDGKLTFSWIANWQWEPGKGPEDDPENIHLQCQDGTKTSLCPAQIQLPFFNMYNFLATMLIIGLVYFVLGFRNKK